jgi:hypothetical protein
MPIAYDKGAGRSPLFEITPALVCFNHIATLTLNAEPGNEKQCGLFKEAHVAGQ